MQDPPLFSLSLFSPLFKDSLGSLPPYPPLHGEYCDHSQIFAQLPPCWGSARRL